MRRVQIVCTHLLSCTARRCAGMRWRPNACTMIVAWKCRDYLMSTASTPSGRAQSAARVE